MSSQTILIEVSSAGVERVTSYIKAASLLAELEPAINEFDALIQSILNKKISRRAKAATSLDGASNK